MTTTHAALTIVIAGLWILAAIYFATGNTMVACSLTGAASSLTTTAICFGIGDEDCDDEE